MDLFALCSEVNLKRKSAARRESFNIPTAMHRATSSESEYYGWLQKWTNYVNGYQRRWDASEVGRTCRGSISLQHATVEATGSSTSTFTVSCGSEKFFLKAADKTLRDAWCRALDPKKTPLGQEEASSGEKPSPNNEATEDGSTFECYICLETAKDAVLSMCGHLFCWSCLYPWLATQPICPVCKSPLTRDRVVPIYGRGPTNDTDTDPSAPARPHVFADRPTNENRLPDAIRETRPQRPSLRARNWD